MVEKAFPEGFSEDTLEDILRDVYGMPDEHIPDILGTVADERMYHFECFVIIHERLSRGDRGEGFDPSDIDPRWTPESWRRFTTHHFLTGELNEGLTSSPSSETMTCIFEKWKSEGPGRAMEVVLNHYALLEALTSGRHREPDEES